VVTSGDNILKGGLAPFIQTVESLLRNPCWGIVLSGDSYYGHLVGIARNTNKPIYCHKLLILGKKHLNHKVIMKTTFKNSQEPFPRTEPAQVCLLLAQEKLLKVHKNDLILLMSNNMSLMLANKPIY